MNWIKNILGINALQEQLTATRSAYRLLVESVIELKSRIKDLENEVLLLDEDYQEFQAQHESEMRGVKASLINFAMKTKLKPKDIVTFDKKIEEFTRKVEDLAEETLTNLDK